jgi:hypothetical protein
VARLTLTPGYFISRLQREAGLYRIRKLYGSR